MQRKYDILVGIQIPPDFNYATLPVGLHATTDYFLRRIFLSTQQQFCLALVYQVHGSFGIFFPAICLAASPFYSRATPDQCWMSIKESRCHLSLVADNVCFSSSIYVMPFCSAQPHLSIKTAFIGSPLVFTFRGRPFSDIRIYHRL